MYSEIKFDGGPEIKLKAKHAAVDLRATMSEFLAALVANYDPERDEDKVRATIQQHRENKQAPTEPSIS